jgi:hypothetical protein
MANIPSLDEIKRLAKIRHEKARLAARRRGRKDFPMLPYECSWAYEEEYRRKYGKNPYGLKIGQRVKTTMGIPKSGHVIQYVPRHRYTDGQYRSPMSRERAVYTKWDDGTQGWSHREHLAAMNPRYIKKTPYHEYAKGAHLWTGDIGGRESTPAEREAIRRGAEYIRRLPVPRRAIGRNPELLIIGNPPRRVPNSFKQYIRTIVKGGCLASTRHGAVLDGREMSFGDLRAWKNLVSDVGENEARRLVREWIESPYKLGRNPARRSAMRIRRRRSKNSWKGHKAAHRRAALKGWRKRSRSRSRKGRKKYAKSGKKYIKMGGKRISWKGLVRRKGVMGAKKIWRSHRKIGGK